MTLEDIKQALKGNKANNDLSFHDITICGGVKYLMPLSNAIGALGNRKRLDSKTLCSSAAFPHGSFFYYGFDNQPDEYNRLYLIVDSADQAVGLQIVDEAPKGRMDGQKHWHCYNFVLQREKAKESLVIRHDVKRHGGCIEVDSFLIDPSEHENTPRTAAEAIARAVNHKGDPRKGDAYGTILEKSKWYLPDPVAEVILYRIEHAKMDPFK